MTNSNILTAVVTQVPFGTFEIEGLMFEDGRYAIALPQLQSKNLIPPNRSRKQLESLLGIVFQSHEKAKTKLHPKAVNVISLTDFEILLAKLDRQGNAQAQELRDALVGLSLHQLFSDAFKIKFEAEDRQAWMTDRLKTKETFWWFTDCVKEYIDTYGSSNPQFHYMNSFKAMSIGLFGLKPCEIKEELGIKKGDLNRDHFGVESLRRIDMIQRRAKVILAKSNGQIKPTASVQTAIEEFDFSVISHHQ